MSKWSVRVGDILARSADLLSCPANPWLNLSGGLGGQLLTRCGERLQLELHRWLASRVLKSVPQGTIVPTEGFGLPFRHIIHAVAIDPFYETSVAAVSTVVRRSLEWAGEHGCSRVVLAALGTGFGRLSHADFGSGINTLTGLVWPGIESVVIVLRSDEDRDEFLATCPIRTELS